MAGLLPGFRFALVALPLVAASTGSSPLLDREGAPLPGRVSSQLAAAGVSGRTTLDGRVQRAADEALDAGLTAARSAGLFPSGGAVVVLGLAERALLAAASSPEPGASRAFAAVPAGSVAKPFVAAAAIGAGLDPAERTPCPSRLRAGGATIHNWRRRDRPALAIPAALSESCNTAFASLAVRLWDAADPGARTAIPRAYRRFGFGFPTGLVSGEEAGTVPLRAPTLGDLMVLAIGQGPFEVTPLQVAVAYAALAGADRSGWREVTGRRAGLRSAPVAGLGPVRSGLELTVREGTARDAFAGVDLDRVPIAGKTGSADVGDATPYAWFAGYAPADRPRYAFAVVVERGRAGALSAAPIARGVLERILDLPPARPGVPLPPPAALLLAIPLAAAFASPAAASLAGLAAGAGAGAIAGGSVPANAAAFAVAGWLAALGLRRARAAALAAGAAVGTVALPAAGWAAWQVGARAAFAGAAAAVLGLAVARAGRGNTAGRPAV